MFGGYNQAMALDPSKDYLTRKACEKAVADAQLSRRARSVLSRHLNAIFQMADSRYANIAVGSFDYPLGDARTVQVHFKRAIGGNDAASLSRDTVLALEPALAHENALQAPSTKRATFDGRLTYITHTLKTKNELGPEWKTYNDLAALLQHHAEQLGRRSPMNHYSTAHISHLTQRLEGEKGTVEGVYCHKYRSHNRMTIAIHESSIPALFDYLANTARHNGHRSVNARINHQSGRGIE